MQNKLLPCPICDKEVSIALMGSEEFHYWWMITRGTNKAGNKNCHCRLFMESEKFMDKDGGEEQKQDLIKKWNTRKPLERIVEQLEELYQYNSEQADVWRGGETSYIREREEMYRDRANCYGVAIRTVKGGVDNAG